MRSRYSAFALCNEHYIIKTTHKENQDFQENTVDWRKDILNFSQNTNFEKLTILEYEDISVSEATVTFYAKLSQSNKDISFTEKSLFFKVDGRWLYHSGSFI